MDCLQNLAHLHAWAQTHDVSSINFGSQADFFTDFREMFSIGTNGLARVCRSDQWKQRLSSIAELAEQLVVTDERLEEMLVMNRKYNIPDTMVHGDIHTQNMLFERDQHGKATGDLLVLVDWQITHWGNPINDLVRLFSFNQPNRSTDYRLPYIHYYFEEHKKSLGPKPISFTEQELQNAFEELYCDFAAMFPPMVLGAIESVEKGKMPVKNVQKSVDGMVADVILWVKDAVAMKKRINT